MSQVVADPVIAQLTGPGGPFEIVVEDVLGVPTQVYAQRMRSLRELIEQSALRLTSTVVDCAIDDIVHVPEGMERLSIVPNPIPQPMCEPT